MKRLTATICLTLAVLLGSAGVAYALPVCEGSPLVGSQFGIYAWDGCEGTFTFANGDKYVGEFRNGNRHGQGTYTNASGFKYVGEYRNGQRHGQGTNTHASGRGIWSRFSLCGDGCGTFKYVGEYRNGQRHGQGTNTHVETGSKYVGEWKNDEFHGQGTLAGMFSVGKKIIKYVGAFRDGKFHGQGTYTTYPDGRMRKGIWQYGKLKYAQKVTPPAMSSGEIENERLENERLENERLKEWIHKIENTLQLR